MIKKTLGMVIILLITVSWNNQNTDKNTLVSQKSKTITFGTKSGEDLTIKKSLIKPYTPNNLSDYEGCYDFGFSEGEYILRVILDKKSIIVQKISYETESPESTTFVKVYKNIEFEKLNKNKFMNKEYRGIFAKIEIEKKIQKGLLFTGLKWNFSEFGYKNSSFEKCLNGKYKKTFYKYLTKEDIKGISVKDLKIMRNEIFARYGYKFKSAGKMDKYFSTKSWYKGQYKNVDSFLTKIEKSNILFLKKHELLENKK